MEIQTGQPQADGRYVAFVQCKSVPDFCEPIIATWHGGRWHSDFLRPVLGWIGPLPVVTTSELLDLADSKMEFDL